jgi:ubiquinone/menaquinone biosynthesis C-methylase UbiE
MLKSEQKFSAPLPEQVAFWNAWNAEFREHAIDRVSIEQRDLVVQWLQQLGSKNLDILEVGCGAGWCCDRLSEFGTVTGTDLSDEVLKRAATRNPDVKYVAGDFMVMDFQPEA